MKLRRALCALAASAAMITPGHGQVKIGVITSATGPTSFVGVPQKNSVALLPKRVGDTTIEYIYLDDASDPTQSVTNVKKLIAEQKIDALIGPSGSPNAIGVIPFAAEAKVPVLAPVGTTAVVLPMDERKRWVFKTTQNDDIIADALIEHMTRAGVKTLGFIGYNDPYGESWHKTIVPELQKAGIRLVADERYNRLDASVTGQVLRLKAAAPDAVLIAGVAAGAALPHMQLVDAGYAGRIYQTHGAATDDFIRIGGPKVEGAILAAGLLLVLDQIAESVPSKGLALAYVTAYEKLYGARPATFGANVYDAGLLLQRAIPDALRKGRPGTPEFRVALRDALEATRELVATQGVYNMTPADHSGFDRRGRVLVTIRDGRWVLLGG
ncbi:MAG TPA: ABC transporter substrate-binding protein [Casimicrobiaceae bacterium]|nr:ABC transporter substrate-binding protein [Casimicrobiaceae bacterium]